MLRCGTSSHTFKTQRPARERKSNLKARKIYMISVVYDEALRPFYRRFGFYEMLCGQMETYECP